MSIEEFQREAGRAFESDANVEVITSIELSRTMPAPRFRVVYSKDNTVIGGSGPSARDAINNCKRRLAQHREEERAKAEKLLGIA